MKIIENHAKKQIKAIEKHRKQLIASNPLIKKYHCDIEKQHFLKKKFSIHLLKGLWNIRIKQKK